VYLAARVSCSAIKGRLTGASLEVRRMAGRLDVRQDAFRLKQSTLFRQQCYVNGAWVDADTA